jgi:hypothetical protein
MRQPVPGKNPVDGAQRRQGRDVQVLHLPEDGLSAAEDSFVVETETDELHDLFDFLQRSVGAVLRTPGRVLAPRFFVVIVLPAFYPFVKPGFRSSERSADGFGLLAIEKALHGQNSLLFFLTFHGFHLDNIRIPVKMQQNRNYRKKNFCKRCPGTKISLRCLGTQQLGNRYNGLVKNGELWMDMT